MDRRCGLVRTSDVVEWLDELRETWREEGDTEERAEKRCYGRNATEETSQRKCHRGNVTEEKSCHGRRLAAIARCKVETCCGLGIKDLNTEANQRLISHMHEANESSTNI